MVVNELQNYFINFEDGHYHEEFPKRGKLSDVNENLKAILQV